MLSNKVKLVINIITLAALGLLIYFSWPQITSGLEKIGGAKLSIKIINGVKKDLSRP